MSRLATLAGFVIGPLAVSVVRQPPAGPVVERATTWAHGLMHRGLSLRLTPWRRNWRYGYALAGPALVLAWRA